MVSGLTTMQHLVNGMAAFAARGVPIETYAHARRDVFGSRRLLDRFIEQHCAELHGVGGLFTEGDQLLIHPRRFDVVVESVFWPRRGEGRPHECASNTPLTPPHREMKPIDVGATRPISRSASVRPCGGKGWDSTGVRGLPLAVLHPDARNGDTSAPLAR